MKNNFKPFTQVILVTLLFCMPLFVNAQRRNQPTAPSPVSSAPTDTINKTAVKEPAAMDKFIKPETDVMIGLTPV